MSRVRRFVAWLGAVSMFTRVFDIRGRRNPTGRMDGTLWWVSLAAQPTLQESHSRRSAFARPLRLRRNPERL